MNDTAAKRSFALDVKEIIKILPHRYPFLLVDRVLEINRDERYILAQKNVSINEAFFQGHFPETPLMPGVLILEALAQCGAVYVCQNSEYAGKLVVLMGIKNAKFRHPVRPGDILLLRCTEQHLSSKGGRFTAEATVDGKMAAEAEFAFALTDRTQV
jgi:3-hydroxyacyl-[acyl-carrier-protein] dehydratase